MPTELILRDGAKVRVRPIQIDDLEGHRAFIAGLSAESRYSRFLHAISRLTETETRHFVDVDGVNRMALVAEDPGRLGGIIGIARYDREPGTSVAEVAIVVGDAWQGRGLGSGLLRALLDTARSHGVRIAVAHILIENAPSLALFHGLGLAERSVLHDGILTLELWLAEGPPFPGSATIRPARE